MTVKLKNNIKELYEILFSMSEQHTNEIFKKATSPCGVKCNSIFLSSFKRLFCLSSLENRLLNT
jgi:hypothetical protein